MMADTNTTVAASNDRGNEFKLILPRSAYYLLAFVMLVVPFWGVTDFPDKYHYEIFIYEGKSRDALFLYAALLLSNFFSPEAIFTAIYRLHIVCIAACYVFLFWKLRARPVFLSFILLLFFYVPMGNQIRYYLAYPLMILALFYWIIKKRRVLAVMLALVAMLSHASVVLVLGLTGYYYYFVCRKSIRYQVINIIVINVAIYLLMSVGFLISEHYGAYFADNLTSSLTGGLYNTIFYLPIYYLLFTIHGYVRRQKMSEPRRLYLDFLFALSIASSYVILQGLFAQVLTNRLIITLLPIWLIYLHKTGSFFPKLKHLTQNAKNICILLYTLKTYVLPYILGLDAEYVNVLIMMVESYRF